MDHECHIIFKNNNQLNKLHRVFEKYKARYVLVLIQ